jgi:subtilisin family serine protease
LIWSLVAAVPTAAAPAPHGRAKTVPGVVLVGYQPGTPLSERYAARESVRSTKSRALSPLARSADRITLPKGTSVDAAISTLRLNPYVRFAEPDYVVSTDAVPNDAGITSGLLWGMLSGTSSPSSPFGTGAIDAWAGDHIGNRDIVVGVIDEGIQIDHPDLAANIWTNPGEIAGNGIDDDGNGYIDDVHGWDFFNDDNSVYDGPTTDGHGTHVAGTIGGVGGNMQGVAGVNWAVTMVSAKFLQGAGDTSDAVRALDYLTDLKLHHGLDIVTVNLSWGGPDFSQALLDAINRGGDAGILYVAAAGNSAHDNDGPHPFYPAADQCTKHFPSGSPRGYDCIVSVAAIDRNGALATFSNYGLTTVDLGAPGVEIVSTYPPSLYAQADGTSMAAPHVTGALALLASCTGALPPNQLRDDLLASGAATASLGGKTATGKRLDVAALTAHCSDSGPPAATITAPHSPTNATTVTETVSFDEAVNGLAASDFSLSGSAAGCSIGSPVELSKASFAVALNGCSEGTVQLTLAADSVVDESSNPGPTAPVSSGLVAIDRHVPTTTVPSLSLLRPGATSGSKVPVRIRWTGSDVGSGIVRYELSRSTNSAAWATVTSTLTTPSGTVMATSGSTVRFRVRAIDAAGNVGAWATGPTIRVSLVQQTSSAVHYTGSWATSSSASYSGGSVRRASARGASASFTFTGRGIGLVSTLAPTRGTVRIYLDGKYVTRLDLRASSTVYRAIVWQTTWSSSHTHTIRLIVDGTAGRPRIDLDAFAVLR